MDQAKYFSVQLDSHLVWDEHLKCMRTEVSQALGFLRYSKEFLPQNTLGKMYRGFVEPHVRYCCSVWGCFAKLKLKSFKNCIIELPESLQIAAIMFQQLV